MQDRTLDQHAPHRFGATAVYDLTLNKKSNPEAPEKPAVLEIAKTQENA